MTLDRLDELFQAGAMSAPAERIINNVLGQFETDESNDCIDAYVLEAVHSTLSFKDFKEAYEYLKSRNLLAEQTPVGKVYYSACCYLEKEINELLEDKE